MKSFCDRIIVILLLVAQFKFVEWLLSYEWAIIISLALLMAEQTRKAMREGKCLKTEKKEE